MKRTVIKIDEELCNGCGACVDGCHEGALQIIDGKARMVSDLFCDGLGACIGECPVGAIELEEREAEPYNERAVMERIVPKGEKTIRAHLMHMKEHNEIEYLQQGIDYLKENNIKINMNDLEEKNSTVKNMIFSGCPGKREISFSPQGNPAAAAGSAISSQLRQWPVQLHLLNPEASYFQNADVVLAADCTAFSYGDFHNRFMKNRVLAIACPKLDNGKESYVEKLTTMIDHSNINTLTVVIMEVPCCGGLLQLTQQSATNAKRKIPIKKIIIGIKGDILHDEWI
jgi:NAD-dependent dihydropyrimidine dehydrogenase PreA subunit